MIWKSNGFLKCPKCGGRLTYYVESEGSDGVKITRYVLRCKSCGYRKVLQEVMVRKTPEGVIVSIPNKK